MEGFKTLYGLGHSNFISDMTTGTIYYVSPCSAYEGKKGFWLIRSTEHAELWQVIGYISCQQPKSASP